MRQSPWTCASCWYFREASMAQYHGECMFAPPVVIQPTKHTTYDERRPMVEGKDWCSHHTEAPNEERP